MTGVFTDTEPRKLGKAIRTLDSEVGPLDVHRIPGWLACEKWDGLPTGYEEFVVATRVERETDLPLRVTHAWIARVPVDRHIQSGEYRMISHSGDGPGDWRSLSSSEDETWLPKSELTDVFI